MRVLQFFGINTPLIAGSVLKYYVSHNFIYYFIYEMVISCIYMFIMNRVDKPSIQNKHIIWTEKIKRKTFGYFIMTMFIKSYTHFYYGDSNQKIELKTIPLFVIYSFIYECLFDFIHYWIHRLSHKYKALYRFHKVHHKFHNPSALTTFYMHPVDVVLSYVLPYLILYKLFKNRIPGFLSIQTTYLMYQEIAGHIGKKMYPTSSFAQMTCLPRYLRMHLWTEDHDYHHSHLHYNFSKRFSLWDRVFGTYKKSCK